VISAVSPVFIDSLEPPASAALLAVPMLALVIRVDRTPAPIAPNNR
jgi:hypothetical protein